jgi:hypothetical protein
LNSRDEEFLQQIDKWQIWKCHKFVILQCWEAQSILEEISVIRLAASEVSANTAKARNVDFKDVITEVVTACVDDLKPIYANEKFKFGNITKTFSFWSSKTSADFITINTEFIRIFKKCIARNPAIETTLASKSSNNTGSSMENQMKILLKMSVDVNSRGYFSFQSSSSKLKPSTGLSVNRAAVASLIQSSILSFKGIQLLKRNCAMATPLDQRIETDLPWVRLLSFSHFRNYHIRAQVIFTTFLRSRVMQEMALLLAIRNLNALKTIGSTEIVPVLLAGPKQVLFFNIIEDDDVSINNVSTNNTTPDSTETEIEKKFGAMTTEETTEEADRTTNEVEKMETEKEKADEETTTEETAKEMDKTINEETDKTTNAVEKPTNEADEAGETTEAAGSTKPVLENTIDNSKHSLSLVGYVFSITNLDLKPNPKGGGIYNRIVMAGTNEFMEDLLGVHVKYGVDPNFKDENYPGSNLYLKAYLRCVLFLCFCVFDFFF